MEWRVGLACLGLFSMIVPLAWGWRSVRSTSLRHTWLWLVAAWLAWLFAAGAPLFTPAHLPLRYLALCLTACSVIAVFGARQPGMAAWNFVVAALLAVLALPLLEQPWHAPHWQLDGPRAIFLGVVLLAGAVNYLPTRLGAFVGLAACAFGLELWMLARVEARWQGGQEYSAFLTSVIVPLLTWVASLYVIEDATAAPVVNLWRTFRDRYGLVWGRRVQEQCNAAAGHAGRGERLRWARGIDPRPQSEKRSEELLELLRATLKRFGLS